MKKNMVFKLRLSDDVAKKLACVSKSEGISIQNQVTQLIRQKIQYFERVKGTVSRQSMETADLCEFECEE